jgi:hypothetical protein
VKCGIFSRVSRFDFFGSFHPSFLRKGYFAAISGHDADRSANKNIGACEEGIFALPIGPLGS